MSEFDDFPEKTIQELNDELRKYLWGVSIGKEKIVKLTEIALKNLTKAIQNVQEKIKQIKYGTFDRTLRHPDLLLERATKELQYLKRELHKFDLIKKTFVTADNPWPRPRTAELPVIPERKPRQEIRPYPQEAPRPQSPKILIIEDESIIIKSISYFLLQENYQVIFSLNAEDGLRKTMRERPDIILLDIMMPGMNGYQFLEQMKRVKAVSNIPVVILSSLARESDILEGLERGASDYVTKPFSPKVLLSKIKKILAAKNGHIPYHSNN